MAAVPVRVLVAIEPRMYREVLAFHLRRHRPRSEVVLASPETLRDEAEHVRPHLIVANDVPSSLKERGLFWVELRTVNGLEATVRANGGSNTIEDVSLQDLLAAMDKTEEELLAHGA